MTLRGEALGMAGDAVNMDDASIGGNDRIVVYGETGLAVAGDAFAMGTETRGGNDILIGRNPDGVGFRGDGDDMEGFRAWRQRHPDRRRRR